MKLKQLEWMLSDMRGFENPDIRLEQYATSAELAIAIVDNIDRLVGFEGKSVADLGCGCGMLMSTVALAYQPTIIVGFEIDDDAIAICKENLENLEIEHCCDLVKSDILQISSSLHSQFDVMVMNPPFGTKNNAGIDVQFVRAGLMMLSPDGSLFSLHKSSTRDYILKTASKWKDVDARCVARLRWNLPTTYKFHKKNSVDIDVDLIHYKKVSISLFEKLKKKGMRWSNNAVLHTQMIVS
ncbi:hypothetical protein KIN20_036493 [Parelaphostrongylus tenuis]|uniref:Methyltransferase-like protein 5 n=1 Tax=Parelaphostrongylus tenuis TaxID=148309 RepID=A0AAD5RDI6_PARTN|nr:hypothetical protein KIN20_036493 [Parelaphostrongylus tenuis]